LGLTIITGYMGSGKTLLATEFALTSKTPVIANKKSNPKMFIHYR